MHPSRHMSRPELMRAHTTRAPYGAGPYQHPNAPHYPDQHPREHRSPHGYYAPPLPSMNRQHHSYYDERGPLPPPPMHMRRPSRDEASYEYSGRTSVATSGSGGSSAMFQHAYQQNQSSFSSASSASSLHGMRMAGGVMMTPSGSSQQPTYRGHIKTTKDAILLLAACDLSDEAGSRRNGGVAPPRRVTRRLLDSERADLICSGSIFVWDEKEAGMRRWTDGKCWSASRVSGCFLTYRELEARKKPSSSITGGPTSNLYKAEGLIKQSFSMTTTSGRKLHAISYYTKRDVREGLLRRVSEDPRFVGEGGGEWGLQVNEQEYPDPIMRAGELPEAAGHEPGSESPPSLVGRPEGGEADSSLADHHDLAAHGGPISPRSLGPDPRQIGSPKGQQRLPHEVGGMPWGGRPSSRNGSPPTAKERDSHPRASYPQDATPLHEARGLLPIQPIPVHSRPYSGTALPAFSPISAQGSDESMHGSYFRHHMPKWSKDGLKRPHRDMAGVDECDTAVPPPRRPRLHRMRSSSLSGPAAGEDTFASVRTLARAGSDEDGVSKMRSTHVWTTTPPVSGLTKGAPEQDSAVGALLSLRSSASDDSGKVMPGFGPMMNMSPATTTPNSTDSSDSGPKQFLSRSDRAALDRFSLRI